MKIKCSDLTTSSCSAYEAIFEDGVLKCQYGLHTISKHCFKPSCCCYQCNNRCGIVFIESKDKILFAGRLCKITKNEKDTGLLIT